VQSLKDGMEQQINKKQLLEQLEAEKMQNSLNKTDYFHTVVLLLQILRRRLKVIINSFITYSFIDFESSNVHSKFKNITLGKQGKNYDRDRTLRAK